MHHTNDHVTIATIVLTLTDSREKKAAEAPQGGESATAVEAGVCGRVQGHSSVTACMSMSGHGWLRACHASTAAMHECKDIPNRHPCPLSLLSQMTWLFLFKTQSADGADS